MENAPFPISSWSEDDKPREKLMLKGKNALSDAELIASLAATLGEKGQGRQFFTSFSTLNAKLESADKAANEKTAAAILAKVNDLLPQGPAREAIGLASKNPGKVIAARRLLPRHQVQQRGGYPAVRSVFAAVRGTYAGRCNAHAAVRSTYAGAHHACAGLHNVRFLDLQPLERLGELLCMADIHLLPQRADAAVLSLPWAVLS
mgnify:CR=1 FL=1